MRGFFKQLLEGIESLKDWPRKSKLFNQAWTWSVILITFILQSWQPLQWFKLQLLDHGIMIFSAKNMKIPYLESMITLPILVAFLAGLTAKQSLFCSPPALDNCVWVLITKGANQNFSPKKWCPFFVTQSCTWP